MRQDTLADVMSIIKNAERVGKKECVTPASNLVKEVLKTFQENNYIGTFEFIDDGKSGQFKIQLINKINDCGIIKPRYPVKIDEYEKFEKRYLPAKDIGILIVSTTKGVTTHIKAKESKTGGRLLSYIF